MLAIDQCHYKLLEEATFNNQQLLFTNEAQLAPTGQSGRRLSVQTSHYTVVLIYGRVAAFVFLNLETLLNSVQVK